MVVIPKSEKHVSICVDLMKLNENVKQSQHILPSVEQLLLAELWVQGYSQNWMQTLDGSLWK